MGRCDARAMAWRAGGDAVEGRAWSWIVFQTCACLCFGHPLPVGFARALMPFKKGSVQVLKGLS